MRLTQKMIQNTDTTVWSGAGFILSLVATWEQAVIAIFTPVISWIMLHYAKKLIAYWEKNKGERINTHELEEKDEIDI
jgi:cbb3-type cytochrome oxidase subunit 3